VRDFVSGEDKIEIDASDFGGGLVAGVLATGRFVSNATGLAGDADDRFIFNTANNYLYYDADGSGSGARAAIAQFTTAPTLTAADFLIVA
jgi:hypothetical protein